MALFVAFLLVVQAALSGLSIGARAADDLSAVGGVLCGTNGASGAGSGPQAPAPHHSTDCCIFGCSMVGGAAAPAPDETASVSLEVGREGVEIVADAPLPTRGELYPRHARAPPERI